MEPLPTDLDALLRHVDRGGKVKPLFFWGHTPKRAGEVDAACLSQWYPAPFVLHGHRFPTAEHAMMWGKARLFGDDDAAADVLVAGSPAQVKAIGRRVRGFDEARWAAHRFDLVVEANVAKFTQNEALGVFLAGTGGRLLVEASPVDRVWGIGLAVDAEGVDDPRRWRGLNLLGFALMVVRARLS